MERRVSRYSEVIIELIIIKLIRSNDKEDSNIITNSNSMYENG